MSLKEQSKFRKKRVSFIAENAKNKHDPGYAQKW